LQHVFSVADLGKVFGRLPLFYALCQKEAVALSLEILNSRWNLCLR
jgi:hypothetical protein